MRHSTNNRMEFRAVLELLGAISVPSLVIQCDSQYVINVFTQWLPDCRRRGMRTSSRKPVENQDLIVAIDGVLRGRDVGGGTGPCWPSDERTGGHSRQVCSRAG
jgi:ribonuclease HI